MDKVELRDILKKAIDPRGRARLYTTSPLGTSVICSSVAQPIAMLMPQHHQCTAGDASYATDAHLTPAVAPACAWSQKNAPRSRSRNEGHALTTGQPSYNLCGAAFVYAQTHQRTIGVNDRPVAPVLPDRHTVSPHRKRGRACALPLGGASWVSARRVALLVRFLTLPV